MIDVNSLVVFKNVNDPIVYQVYQKEENNLLLKGYIYRITNIASLNEVIEAPESLINHENEILNKTVRAISKQTTTRNKKRVLFGTILHIDGDEKFLNSCLELYKEMKIHSWGAYIKEKEINNYLDKILNVITPDIIVITGHDYYNGKDLKDINNYENSKEFVKSLQIVRKRFNSDSVIVIIGACGSCFEALIANGANFASSPKRINIHTYDPAVIAIKCATTSANQYIDFEKTLKFIENGKDAYGGIETKGKMKLLL